VRQNIIVAGAYGRGAVHLLANRKQRKGQEPAIIFKSMLPVMNFR
jgi:hypothetical protein